MSDKATFRVSHPPTEREMLKRLSETMDRSEGATLRTLIRQAARELNDRDFHQSRVIGRRRWHMTANCMMVPSRRPARCCWRWRACYRVARERARAVRESQARQAAEVTAAKGDAATAAMLRLCGLSTQVRLTVMDEKESRGPLAAGAAANRETSQVVSVRDCTPDTGPVSIARAAIRALLDGHRSTQARMIAAVVGAVRLLLEAHAAGAQRAVHRS